MTMRRLSLLTLSTLLAASVCTLPGANRPAKADEPVASPTTIVPVVSPPVTPTGTEDTTTPVPPGTHAIEVVFVLDTTGSMSGLIHAAKEKIWAIAGTLGTADPAPEIRMGLIGYRDRGDAYVTKMTPLTTDLDTVYSQLMDFVADGGNDAPESVNQALFEAVHQTKWTAGKDTYRVIFLVGDAPPHIDYDDDVQYQETCKVAAERGIFVNTVQCGSIPETAPIWKEIAGLSDGMYAAIDASGGAVVPETPLDTKLVELSQKLDATRIYYGSGEVKMEQERKLSEGVKIYDNASLRSVAQRATFNSCPSGQANFCGSQELVNDYLTEKIKLTDVKSEDLPEPMRKLSTEELEAKLKTLGDERKALQEEILAVSTERQQWIRAELERLGENQPELDRTIFEAIMSQAATHGIAFKAAAPSL